YLAFAKKADEDGFKQAAKLFRAAAEAETVHALNHLRTLNAVRSTEENLKEAINGETHEFTEMYPQMIREAEEEGNSAAKLNFSSANNVEKIHASLYEKALSSIQSGSDMESGDIHVCQVCGNTVEGNALDKCPICGVGSEMFSKVE
ncbi:MAG: rubrerythrin family protein, partial [Candidatus Aenigmarchaeota archaeon]|nr:rubrerythrin family protein [Candidatus Aenigmarchaeota archaeon]